MAWMTKYTRIQARVRSKSTPVEVIFESRMAVAKHIAIVINENKENELSVETITEKKPVDIRL